MPERLPTTATEHQMADRTGPHRGEVQNLQDLLSWFIAPIMRRMTAGGSGLAISASSEWP